MEFAFTRVDFADVLDDVRAHLATLPSVIDSYLEGHIRGSNHYRITVGGEPAGYASIHKGNLITQFVVDPEFRQHGQELFARLRRTEFVQSAYVATCDEFLLAHALDNHRALATQAFFFAARATAVAIPAEFRIREAAPGDAAWMRQEANDFLEPVDEQIARGELFVTLRGGEPVGFGIRLLSGIYPDVASVGMFTLESARHAGAGTATIALLIAECRRRGLRPVAGCWYYNHASKRTLERAGMASSTRLLKIDF